MPRGRIPQHEPSEDDCLASSSPEATENRLIALAYDLAEKRIRAGTASSQEVVHFLKLGSSKSREEVENLKAQNKLLQAKTEALEADKATEEKYNRVIKAMSIYQGREVYDEDIL